MLLVVDAAELFAALIKDGKSAEIIVSDNIELITPEFIISEFKSHKDELLSKTHRSAVVLTALPEEVFSS